jgi:ribosomal protein L17
LNLFGALGKKPQVVDLAPLREQNTKLTTDVQEAKAQVAKLQAESRSQIEQRTIFKDLYDNEAKRYSELFQGYTRLDKENNQLKRENEQLKSQQRRK